MCKLHSWTLSFCGFSLCRWAPWCEGGGMFCHSHEEALETPDWLEQRAEVRLLSQLWRKQNKTSCDWWVLNHDGLSAYTSINVSNLNRQTFGRLYCSLTETNASEFCVLAGVKRRKMCGSCCSSAELTCRMLLCNRLHTACRQLSLLLLLHSCTDVRQPLSVWLNLVMIKLTDQVQFSSIEQNVLVYFLAFVDKQL